MSIAEHRPAILLYTIQFPQAWGCILSREHVERRLAAILAADVAGSCRLIGIDEEGTLAQLKALRRTLFDPKITDHRGRVVKNTGDGALVEFGSVVDAVRCAVEIQRGMAEHNIDVPEVKRIEFRIGIHVGDIIIEDHDIFGDGVNIAARLESIAEPGGVCMSDDAYRQVRGKVEIACDDMGQQSLKNIADPMRAWRVRLTGQTPSAVNSGSAVSQPRVLPLPDKPSIAVLPFENMSGDPEQEYFADGMVEEIITALSRNHQLFVIARNSSFTFKGRAVDIKQVARDLGVRYVLEGSVRKSGNRIRITGQLIDAASGAHLWADRYDGALEDVFELQDQVAASVVGAIAPSLTQAEMERAKRKPTNSLDAYDCYLRGLTAHWQYTKDSTEQAGGLFERSVALDPQFAPAYAALAATLNTRKVWGWSADPAADASQAVAYAKRALRLGRQDAWVLAQSAVVLFSSSDKVELADSLLDEAIHLDPNGMLGWMWGGWTKMMLGDHQTAIHYLQRALRLSPLDPRIFFAQVGLAYAYFFLGNYEEGLKCAADALRHHPSYVAALRITMACNALSGNIEAAQKVWRQVALLSPSDRVSETRKRAAFRRDQDLAKIQEAYRLAGMPE
jgi:TolB-like protein/class 3 adenylate cyclase/Tfp pilus assembly protein PilF